MIPIFSCSSLAVPHLGWEDHRKSHCNNGHLLSHTLRTLTLSCSFFLRNQMWNLQNQIRFSLSTPLTSIPLELWSIGKLKTLLTPNAPDIVVIYFLLCLLIAKISQIVSCFNDLNTQSVSQFYYYFMIRSFTFYISSRRIK